MNKINIYFSIICLAGLLYSACGGSATDQSVRDDARNSLSVPENVAPPASTPAISAPITAAGAGSVQHYICSNNCAGSGGATAGTCPVCGSAYVHNQAYHSQGGASTTPSTSITPPVTTPEPAQNAAGVWHYTCSKGCAGGGAGATACGTCGETLVHNTAYHN